MILVILVMSPLSRVALRVQAPKAPPSYTTVLYHQVSPMLPFGTSQICAYVLAGKKSEWTKRHVARPGRVFRILVVFLLPIISS